MDHPGKTVVGRGVDPSTVELGDRALTLVSLGTDEPVCPELALVDPILARRLRALLPMPEPEPERQPAEVPRREPDPEPEPEPGPGPDDERERETVVWPGLDRRGPDVPRLVIAPRLVGVPRREEQSETGPDVVLAAPTAFTGRPVTSTARSRSFRRVLVAFVACAAAASLAIAVLIWATGGDDRSGVVAGTERSRAGSVVAGPTPTPPAAPSGSRPKAAPAAGEGVTAPTRKLVWVPVEGAVSYRLELFRGERQVLRVTTRRPEYELASRWTYQGRDERLTPGSYRWYVWPVLRYGPAARAVVQARLDVQ